jgi:hypothetical protein
MGSLGQCFHAAPFFCLKIMRNGQITLDALVKCFHLNRGEFLQLLEWIRRYPDLLEAEPGVLYLEPAIVAARIVRRGFNPGLKLKAP